MTDLRDAARQALEALEEVQNHMNTSDWFDMRVAALKAALAQPTECRWLQDGDEDSGTYMASCNRRYFVLEDGTPTDNHMTHCCYCGKPLVEVPIEREDEDD
jgi:hypothetical protein